MKTLSPICSCSKCCVFCMASCRHWTKNNRNPLHRTASPLGSTTTVYSLFADFFSPKRQTRMCVRTNYGLQRPATDICAASAYSLVSFKHDVVDWSNTENDILTHFSWSECTGGRRPFHGKLYRPAVYHIQQEYELPSTTVQNKRLAFKQFIQHTQTQNANAACWWK